MKKLIIACIIFLCLFKEWCDYEVKTSNNGDEQRPDIRIRPAINLDDTSEIKFRRRMEARKT